MRAIFPLLTLAMLARATHADDWPQWRGPMRDWVWREDGILEKFPAGGVKIAWRAEAGGGWSIPVVAAGKVFLAECVLRQRRAN